MSLVLENAVRHNTTENVARLVCDSSVSVNYSSSSDSPEDYNLSDPEVSIKCSVSSTYFGDTHIESIQMMLSIVRDMGEGVDVGEFVVIKVVVEVVGVKSRIRPLEKDGLHK